MYYAELLGINKTGAILAGATVNLRVYNTDLFRYYCKIQEAIDDALTTNTIVTEAGDYYEEITVNKQLTIRGAKYLISGCWDPAGQVSQLYIRQRTIRIHIAQQLPGSFW